MRNSSLSLLSALAIQLACVLPAAADHDPAVPPTAPTTIACTDFDNFSHDFTIGGTGPEASAFGAYSAPVDAPSVLVVIGHGSTHTAESWKAHMEGMTNDYGVLAVAMEYRGMQRVAGHHDPDDTLPLAENWPQKAGGEDLIAAALRFKAECPSIDTTILVGVSMGVAMTGYAVSHLPIVPPTEFPIFDYWVAVEGVHDTTETYHEAAAVDHPAAGWIETECGGTPAEVPIEYQERTNLAKVAEIALSGLERVVYLHAVYDGTVGYHQSRQMAQQLPLPFEFYTVTEPGDERPDGTTGTDLFIENPDNDPNVDPTAGLLGGHAGEWRADALLMEATFERVGALALQTPTHCGEYHVDPVPLSEEVTFTPVATHPCSFVGNLPPTATDDNAFTHPSVPVTIDVLANDSDPDNDPITNIAATPGEQGSTTVEPDGRVTYTPDAGFTGGDTFDYIISDSAGGSDTGTVTMPEPRRGWGLLAGLLLLVGLQGWTSSATPRTKRGSIP